MILYIFLLHFIADFLLQSREIGKKKSEEFGWLLIHLGIQWSVLMLGLLPFYITESVMLFVSLNCLIHGIQDWYIWRIYKISVFRRFPKANLNFKYWEDTWFYSTIGFDQLLHFSTLYLLWKAIL